MKKLLVVFISLILTLSACTPLSTWVTTPTNTSTPSFTATITTTPTITDTPTITQTPTKTLVPTKTKIPTKTPVPTSIYADMGSLPQFIAKYFDSSLTAIKRKTLVDKSMGKWVSWTGTVDQSTGLNGGVYVILYTPTYVYGSLLLIGIPKTVMENLNAGQTIHFTGQLTQFEWWGDPYFGNLVATVEHAQIIK